MSNYLTQLLTVETWELIFSVAFFLGLLFTIYIIIGALNSGSEHDSDGHDADHDVAGDHDLAGDHDITTDHDLSADHEMDLDHDMDLDSDMDLDHDIIILDADNDLDADDLSHDMGHDVDSDMDHGLDLDHDFSLDHDVDFDADLDIDGDLEMINFEINDFSDVGAIRDRSHTLKSNFMMGNISVFLLFSGQIGWMYVEGLSDAHIFFALLTGYLASRAFAYVIKNYTKTVVVPLVKVRKGDIARVQYQVSQKKPGLVNVMRQDGVIDPVMAKGAYSLDTFGKNELGMVTGKEGQLYIITKHEVRQN